MFGGRMRTEPDLAAALKMSRPSSVRAVMFRLSALAGWTSLPYLRSIRHQALIVCGDDDPVTPHVNHRVMAALIPSAAWSCCAAKRTDQDAGNHGYRPDDHGTGRNREDARARGRRRVASGNKGIWPEKGRQITSNSWLPL